jgi:hypothetical protein
MRSPDHSRLSLLETEGFAKNCEPLFFRVHAMCILLGKITKEKIGKNPYICSKNFSQKSMLETVIREIQNRMNECINQDLTSMSDSLSLKLQYFDNEQRKSFLQQELFRITDLLVQFRKNRVIDSLFEYTDNIDFLWDSTFIEHLSPDEKKKYRHFDFNRNEVHDENIPYFSQIELLSRKTKTQT